MKTFRSILLCSCALLGGCAAPLPSVIPAVVVSPSLGAISGNPTLHISNLTSLVVTLEVNGKLIGNFQPDEPSADLLNDMPPLPWIVIARSRSGRVLASLQVPKGDGPANGGAAQVMVDLSCGRLWIWAGDVTPDAPVIPSPFATGDCQP